MHVRTGLAGSLSRHTRVRSFNSRVAVAKQGLERSGGESMSSEQHAPHTDLATQTDREGTGPDERGGHEHPEHIRELLSLVERLRRETSIC